jgi:hypothetical protein
MLVTHQGTASISQLSYFLSERRRRRKKKKKKKKKKCKTVRELPDVLHVYSRLSGISS